MPPLSLTFLKCATINVRGLSQRKFSLVSDFFRASRLDFCFIQETMISNDAVLRSFSSSWPGPSFWAPAVGRRGGVAILCSDVFRNNVSVWQKDQSGRILSLLVKFDDFNLNLVNLYVPTIPAERKIFFQSVPSFFLPNSRLLIGGDMNCFDSTLDKLGRSVSLDSGFSDLKSCCNLRDAWRLLHPRDRQFTWFSPDHSIASRLDTFLVPRLLCNQVTRCGILPCVFSDHNFVILDYDIAALPLRGPGVWKFNNSFLDDESFCLEILDLIEQFLAFRHCFASQRDFWECLKSDIKLTAIAFSRRKHRLLSSQKVFLTNRLIALKNRLASGDVSASPEILTLEAALRSLLDSELEGSKIRSRVKWAEEGESPSGFFLGLENERHEKGSVSSVFDSEGQEVFSLPDMIQAHERFYSSLFSEEPIDPVAQSHLFEHVTRRLSEAERESCEGLLSLNEASEALRLSNRNKTPGSDGLTVEFYSAFWSLLGPLLVDMFNESLAHREVCDSMKSSVTRLVHKKDDRRNLKNWRPISLLNVDYKICSKALSLRLKKVLGSIVDPDQTCSVPGRSISSNLALLRDTLDFIERTGETGVLISLDQEKAFDRVNRSFLMNLLEHFGFGPSFCSWIFSLYNGAYMRILVNDFLSDPVPLLRGVRQGDALSPMLYVLCVEVLACRIRDSPAIEGFLLPGAGGVQFKVGQYADDTTAFVKNDSSLFSLFDAIAFYERGSGAKLNLSKTEAMWLGAWKDRLDEPLGLTWVRKMKILGVFFGTVDVERDNWEPRLSKLDKTLSRWKSRSLSFIGKVLILNILALSKLLYVSRVLVPPKWF